jgi:hypothetical protein
VAGDELATPTKDASSILHDDDDNEERRSTTGMGRS